VGIRAGGGQEVGDFLGCSLLVAVVVGVVKRDVQGAFTVPGFLETGVGVGVAITTLSATVDYLS